MNEPILKAVAMPPKLFWAPMVPAIANLGIQLPFVFFLIALYRTNPLWVVGTVLIVHVFLIALGAKDPHLSNMMKSQGPFMKNYKSMCPASGRKIAS